MSSTSVAPKIGILAIQGDFAAHSAMLHSLGAETVEVRTVGDLQQCDALILPGGESTTQLHFLQEEGLFEAIKKFAAKNQPIFGTCAGAKNRLILRGKLFYGFEETFFLKEMQLRRRFASRKNQCVALLKVAHSADFHGFCAQRM